MIYHVMEAGVPVSSLPVMETVEFQDKTVKANQYQ